MSTKRPVLCVTLFALSSTVLFQPFPCFASCTDSGLSDLRKYINRPQTERQLLSNIKAAFDGDFLLAPEFYSDTNLMRLFNSTSVQWHSLAPPEMQEAAVAPGTLPVGIRNITVRTWKNAKPPRDSDLGIEVAPGSGLTLGAVREVFGKETSTIPPERPSHPMAPNAYIPRTYPSIAYIKIVPQMGIDCPATRVEARFSADVALEASLGTRRLNQQPLPDQGVVVSVSLKVRRE